MPLDDPGAPLSAVWVGHATVLLRFGHRFVITDPNLGGTIFIQQRVTPASLRADELPPLQFALLSHMHLDHFDVPTLRQLNSSAEVLYPDGGQGYCGAIRQTRKLPMRAWESVEAGGIKVTAVPIAHSGGRFAFDSLWNHAATGYIIEGAGQTVFFAGDTGWDPKLFKELARRFPKIDVAFIPIAPAKGGNKNHADPKEALDIFQDTGARYLVPIHFEAYHSMAVPLDEPRKQLLAGARERGLSDRVFALHTGERWVLPEAGGKPWVTRELASRECRALSKTGGCLPARGAPPPLDKRSR